MEEDDDLEALRLAALQTIKPRQTHKTLAPLRQRENNPYYRQKKNSNLIEIVPKDELFVPSFKVISAPSKDVVEAKDSREPTDEESEQDEPQAVEEHKAKKIRSKFLTDSENEDGKSLKLDEDQLDFEDESDLLEIDDDDSLERLMDEMEQEFSEEKPQKNEAKAVKKPSRSKSPRGQEASTKKLIKISQENDQNKAPPSPIHKSPRRSQSPKNRFRRSFSPVEGRRQSPGRRFRRTPSPRNRRSPSPRIRRSPSPRQRRSPSPRLRRSPSPRLRRSPSLRLRRSPRRSLSPRLRRSRSPRLRRSPSPRMRRSPSPRSRRSPSPRLRRSPSPRSRRLSPISRSRRPPSLPRKRRSLSPRSKRSPSPRPLLRTRRPLSPVKTSPSHVKSSHRSPLSGPRRRTPSLSPPRKKKPSPIRHRPRSRSPILNRIRRSLSPRPRPVGKRSPMRKRSESPIHEDQNTSCKLSKKKEERRLPQVDELTKESSENGLSLDPKLEARRKKFESNTIVAPTQKKIRLRATKEEDKEEEQITSPAPKKIRLRTTKVVRSESEDINEEEPVLIKISKKNRVPLEEDTLDFEEDSGRINEIVEVDDDHYDESDNLPSSRRKTTLKSQSPPGEVSLTKKSVLKDSKFTSIKLVEKIKARTKAKLMPITYSTSEIEVKKKSKKKKQKKLAEEVIESLFKSDNDISSKSRTTMSGKTGEDVDNGSDLRAELSRRRAERLKETHFQPAARIIQSAFEGVVSRKNRTQKSVLAEKESPRKTLTLQGRRVRVVCQDSNVETLDKSDEEDSSEEVDSVGAMRMTSIGRSTIIKRNKV